MQTVAQSFLEFFVGFADIMPDCGGAKCGGKWSIANKLASEAFGFSDNDLCVFSN